MKLHRQSGVESSGEHASEARAPGKRTLTDHLRRSRKPGVAPSLADMEGVAAEAIDRKGGGTTLDPGVRSAAEGELHTDLGGVRVHTDENAHASSEALGARAYAYKQDVFLGKGESPTDRHLMGHELTHVAQHQGVNRFCVEDEDECSPAEDEAERKAKRIAATTAKPAWTEPEIRAIQKQLIRLGLYRFTVDGDLGAGTDSALVEAFGGDKWRTMKAADVLAKLEAAKPPPGKKGEHNLRYGEMFKDGVLDMTLALGFDEGSPSDPTRNTKRARDNFRDALTARGFKEDKALAIQIYKDAGRTIDAGAFGEFYVKKDALTYKPPAGDEKKIHAVVRLAYSLDGSQGKEVAEAYKAGMAESDIAYYSGHGRYGSGPDFDRNFSFRLLDKDGNEEQLIERYQILERELEREGAPHGRGAWRQFLWRVENKRLEVKLTNEGNVVINDKNAHPGEFGSNLMYWAINQKSGGAKKVTGKDGELAKAHEANPDRKYRVVVFDGCRSVDYNTSVRATPGYDSKSADVFGSSKSLNWGDEGPTLAVFLDSIVGMQSAEQIAKNMDEKQSVGPNAYHVYGASDNPVIK